MRIRRLPIWMTTRTLLYNSEYGACYCTGFPRHLQPDSRCPGTMEGARGPGSNDLALSAGDIDLDPALVLSAFVLRLGTGLQGICLLYASSLLLRTVETGLTAGAPDVNAILWAIVVRIICSVFFTLAHWVNQRLNSMLQTRITLHFEEYMLRETLRLDLPTIEGKFEPG
ncbi:hypothetical protein FB451DRAFT_1227502 [Mycena latifolia]|nr:hypothetical protein FB451DRAFT_1227502 [Mycena latifolia]